MVSSVSSSTLASAWASQIFSKVDTSNQGYIDKAGLQTAFDKIGASDSSSSTSSTSSSSSSSTNVDQLFSSLDSDSDGKVTKDELTSSLKKVADQLNSQFDQMRMGMAGAGHGGPGGPSGAGGPPPGPPPGGGNDGDSDDSGFTKDELTQQLSEIGTSDSKRSSLISSVVNNFDKADSNGDGKVSRQEAMAFDQSQNSSSTSSSSSASSSGTTNSATSQSASTISVAA